MSATTSILGRGISVIIKMKVDSTKHMLFVTISGHSPKPRPYAVQRAKLVTARL